MKQEIANIIQLPRISDPRGNLTVAEEQKNIPFHIKHVEWRYGMPAGTSLDPDIHHPKQVFIALSGSFTIESRMGNLLTLSSLIIPIRDFIWQKM